MFNVINDEEVSTYYKLEKNTQFIYRHIVGDFLAIKYNNKYCIALSCKADFFVLRVYDNCFSIGSGDVKNFNTYQLAIKYIQEKDI